MPIDTRRNLRALRGALELYPSGMETVGFVASRDRAAELVEAVRAGARLRVGFFLGFDDPRATRCLLRPAAGVSTVRMDVAFIELLDPRGAVLAREDTDRLRAWLDDASGDVPGEGPRAAVGTPFLVGRAGQTPAPWRQALEGAARGPLGRALGGCHASGIARGGEGAGQVVVRLTIDARSGAVQQSEVELSSVEDDEEATCIARAFSSFSFSPAPELWGPPVSLSVPIRLVD